MQTLGQAVLAREAVGKRLILPWYALNEQVQLRTKELVVVAGAPGGGKSTVAVNLAMATDFPLLYLAQDTPASVLARMAAIAVEADTRDMFKAISDGADRIVIADELKDVRPTLVFERGAMTLEDVQERVDALYEWLGEYPSMIIIDNLIDMRVAGTTHGEMAFYTTALPYLKQMANEQNLAVVVLHHVTKGGGDDPHGRGNTGLALGDLLFAGEREARHVWGVYNNGLDTIYMQVLKQQDGPADADGGMEIPLKWYPRMGRLLSAAG